MNIQDLHVGDKILVTCDMSQPFYQEYSELEVLDIRGQYLKTKHVNGMINWSGDISGWTLIEKLLDGAEQERLLKEAVLDGLERHERLIEKFRIPPRTRPDFLNLSDRSDCGGEED